MYVDIVISNAFNLNKHFSFLFFLAREIHCFIQQHRMDLVPISQAVAESSSNKTQLYINTNNNNNISI